MKRLNKRLMPAAGVLASVLILTACGSSDDPVVAAEEETMMDGGSAGNGGNSGSGDTDSGNSGGDNNGGNTGNGGDSGSGDNGSSNPGPNPSTIPLASSYPAFTDNCSLGVSTVAGPDSTATWTYNDPVVTFFDGSNTVTMTLSETPVGEDDQPTNPTSATFDAAATNGAGAPFNVTLTVNTFGLLIGAGYNPDPSSATPTQAELDAVDAQTVLCGSLALPAPRPPVTN
ncbi:MAG: hypothetical protein AB8C46_20670 [Burkholderiaceae bacterium]